jgi:hypothetical protein
MDDYPEDLMGLKDEIEDPIYEMEGQEMKSSKIRPICVNLHRMLLGLCQDVEEGRFPLFHDRKLMRETKVSKVEVTLSLVTRWIKALEKERLSKNQGAIYWTKLLEAFPSLLEEDIPEDAEDWALQLRRWRS